MWRKGEVKKRVGLLADAAKLSKIKTLIFELVANDCDL